jgi:hypothetical protein
VIKSSQRARKMGYVGCMGEKNAYRVLWGNHLEDIGVDGKIIFKRIFKI